MFFDLGDLDLTKLAVCDGLFDGLVRRSDRGSGIGGDDGIIVVSCGCFDNRITAVGEPACSGCSVRTGSQVRDDCASAVLDLECSTGDLTVVMFFRFRDLDLAKLAVCDSLFDGLVG